MRRTAPRSRARSTLCSGAEPRQLPNPRGVPGGGVAPEISPCSLVTNDGREAAAEDGLDAFLPELDQKRSDADAAVDQGQSAFGHSEPAHDSRLVRFEWTSVS